MRVSGDLDFLSRAQGAKNFIPASGCERFELQQLLANINLRIPSQLTDLLDLLFELHKRFLEIKQRSAGH